VKTNRVEPTARVAKTESGIRDLITSAQPGQTLELVFEDQDFDDERRRQLYMLFPIFDSGELIITRLALSVLEKAFENGRWETFRTYRVVVGENFDAGFFLKHARDMIESAEIITDV
jgi:hypothetical protein